MMSMFLICKHLYARYMVKIPDRRKSEVLRRSELVPQSGMSKFCSKGVC